MRSIAKLLTNKHINDKMRFDKSFVLQYQKWGEMCLASKY